MSYLALYRKYRPTTFNELIGQDHIVKTLVNQIKSGMIGHAYLFTGTRGTGKTSAAKIFAKAINCENNDNGSPCGKCRVCLELSDPSNIDIIEIDAASNNGVNEIRELRENVQYPPVSGKYKVYIIDEVHMLTGAAFNALLKTLEEPPKHAVFILATTEVHKIPATILSRCMRFDFRLIPTETIADLISKIYDEQGKEYEKEAVLAIAKAGEGSIRDALSVADIALSYSDGKLTYEDVINVLGATNGEVLSELAESIIAGDSGKVLEITDRTFSSGKNLGVIVKDFISFMRNLIVVKTCEDANKILLLPENRFAELKAIADKGTEEKMLRTLSLFCDMETSLKYAANPRVLFESVAVKAAKPDSDYSIDALLARIKELENRLSEIEKSGVAVVPANETSEIVEEESESIPTDEEKAPEYKPTVKSSEEIEIKDLIGTLLIGIRNSGSEMLYNVLQSVSAEFNDGVLTLTTKTDSDRALLEKESSKEAVRSALSGLGEFKIEVRQSEKDKYSDEIEIETERIKKAFGEDIVIVK
ncbi:MAG: DNA polymerase III subunit gamma/tau [Clostridia bacterium]|nr:DNA polymerase III subunit gamma/tau [Clostridia bacterium]